MKHVSPDAENTSSGNASTANRGKSTPARPAGGRPHLIERLFADNIWSERYRVSAEERVAIANAAMMGEVRSERDVLFILNQLRRARLRW